MHAMAPLNSVHCALFLVTALTFAGVAHTFWLRTSWAARLAIPVDGGLTLRGRRLFGANKTLRGFVVFPPAAALGFGLLGAGVQRIGGSPEAAGLWGLSTAGFALLGLWAGAGFMLGELPNSFFKRQFKIAPGAAPGSPVARAFCFLVDRTDSILGMLFAVWLWVPTPWELWALTLLMGVGIHWGFSAVLFRLGLKLRAA